MPGPMSAPNGDARLVDARIRAKQAKRHTLRTGKTALARTRREKEK